MVGWIVDAGIIRIFIPGAPAGMLVWCVACEFVQGHSDGSRGADRWVVKQCRDARLTFVSQKKRRELRPQVTRIVQVLLYTHTQVRFEHQHVPECKVERECVDPTQQDGDLMFLLFSHNARTILRTTKKRGDTEWST